MKTLNFDTGIVTYSLNDKCEISINPTDSSFVNKVADTFEKIEAIGEACSKELNPEEPAKLFALCEKRNTETRKLIDELLGDSVCNAVFGDMDVFALANGLPVWQNLFFAVLEEMDTSVLSEKSKTKARLEKYTSKYRR